MVRKIDVNDPLVMDIFERFALGCPKGDIDGPCSIECRKAIVDVVAALSDIERSCLHARWVDGKVYREIGEQHGITLHQAYNITLRAMNGRGISKVVHKFGPDRKRHEILNCMATELDEIERRIEEFEKAIVSMKSELLKRTKEIRTGIGYPVMGMGCTYCPIKGE